MMFLRDKDSRFAGLNGERAADAPGACNPRTPSEPPCGAATRRAGSTAAGRLLALKQSTFVDFPSWSRDALNILSKDVWNAYQRARRLLLDGARLRPLCVGYTRSKLLFTTISNASIKAVATRPGKFSGRSMPARLTTARDGLIVDVVKVEDSKVSARRKLEEPLSLIWLDIKMQTAWDSPQHHIDLVLLP
jgi:hypothetical protein